MTGWRLFNKRLFDDYKYQRKVLSTVIDWVIFLYLSIPTVAIGVIVYVDLWNNFAAYWFSEVPFLVFIGFIFFIASFGSIRVFMQDADILFLLDRQKLYRNFRKWGFVFSFVQLGFYALVMIGTFLPFFIQGYGFGLIEIIFMYIILTAYFLTGTTLHKVVRHIVLRILSVLGLLFTAILLMSYLRLEVVAFFSFVGVLILCIGHFTKLVPSKRYFFKEVDLENKARARYAKMILGMATSVEKTPIRFGKRPIFLRKSRRFFQNPTPDDGLLELLLKGFLRNSVYRGGYLRLISITLGAIIILPLWGKWLVFLIAFFFFQYNSWLKGLFEKLMDQQFFSVIPVDKALRERVWIRFKKILMIPAISILGLATMILSVVIWIGGI